jgi:hypothetical protein
MTWWVALPKITFEIVPFMLEIPSGSSGQIMAFPYKPSNTMILVLW